MGQFQGETNFTYKLNGSEHGIYIMALEGSVIVANTILENRDAIGVSDVVDIL